MANPRWGPEMTKVRPIDELAPGLTGRQALEAVIAIGGRFPIGDTLDFALTEVGDGLSVFEGSPGPGTYNPMGTVHGGYAATLLDSACGCAVHTILSADQIYTTLELKISYLRALIAETGMLRAEGRVVKSGRKVAFAEAILRDLSGRIFATATSTFALK